MTCHITVIVLHGPEGYQNLHKMQYVLWFL